MMNYKLEICVDSIESALNAQLAGADRIELCDNLIEGGTTPSYGTIISARSNLNIMLHVIIRPRGGDFLYTDTEYDVMRRDIEVCGESGADGIVTGILTADGKIDIDRTASLVEFARPMSVTFHRAFDMCADPVKGLESIIQSGADRLLTSGQKKTAIEGSDLINKLIKQAQGRIIIMPGSGIDDHNIASIAKATGASEYHLTGRKTIQSRMEFRKKEITMSGYPGYDEFSGKVTDTDKIRRIIDVLRAI
ncbi:MAG TPA: copper homeostasis protein CutC [Bacteroidales bacterium]|nr:copper homeostasis protein CutC [Bacteroidales bacterium]HBQ83499.1 copper homeostasis protein CutC [Bacteroidales bacterium]HCU18770.1 copper homeostasis protein CutC [Bacteroidales bacterium]